DQNKKPMTSIISTYDGILLSYSYTQNTQSKSKQFAAEHCSNPIWNNIRISFLWRRRQSLLCPCSFHPLDAHCCKREKCQFHTQYRGAGPENGGIILSCRTGTGSTFRTSSRALRYRAGTSTRSSTSRRRSGSLRAGGRSGSTGRSREAG